MWSSGTPNGVTVRDNQVRDGRYGLHFMYSSGSTVADNLFQNNAVGAYAMYSNDLVYERNRFVGNHGPSGYGVALKDSDNIAIRDNAFVANRTGLYLDNSPYKPGARNQIEGNTFAYNDIGLTFTPAVKGNVLAGNNLVDNFQQVSLTAGGDFEGNDWTPEWGRQLLEWLRRLRRRRGRPGRRALPGGEPVQRPTGAPPEPAAVHPQPGPDGPGPGRRGLSRVPAAAGAHRHGAAGGAGAGGGDCAGRQCPAAVGRVAWPWWPRR